MKRKIIFFALVLNALCAMSQDWTSVKSSPLYLYGEGWGVTVAEADKQALGDLISKIAINISSQSQTKDESSVSNGTLDETSQFSQSINTYSQATLTNTERIILSNEPDAHIGRWIKRSEIERIFNERKSKAIDLVETALRAEEKGKADDALRNYYWSLSLLKSLQNPNSVKYTDESGISHVLTNWIKERMDGVFDDLKAKVVSRENDNVQLLITYRDKPVNSVDYTYFDGLEWSNLYSAKDGNGVLELANGNVSTTYQLKYEYEYRSEAVIDKELESVLNVIKGTPMRKAYVTIQAEEKDVKRNKAVSGTFTSTASLYIQKPTLMGAEASKYSAVLNQVTQAIRTKDYTSVKSFFTEEGWSMYEKLIHYGNARLLDSPDLRFYQSGDYAYSRGLNMSFSFAHGVKKSFVEDVVFAFNPDAKICNIAFGLGRTAEDDILNKGVWSEQARFAIMNFLENYKTAYALKRLDYIRMVFDDDAVIITGSVAKRNANTLADDNVKYYGDNEIIRYNRQTKDEYLKNLQHCFARNEFVNLRFTNNEVMKLGIGGELYAIQIQQDYYSSTYGDKGYLFLMVDINNPDKPLIKVRTWQPEKDPNFGLYGPGDF
jgi:hypothetical protein